MTETGVIVESMRALAAKYVITFGRPPLGFVMGIKDYHAMRFEMRHMAVVSGRPQAETTLDGLPIHLKISSGIELLVHQEAAERVLMELQASRVEQARQIIQDGIIR